VYKAMLQDQLLPVLQQRRDLRQIWFMQDGAPCHCTDSVLQWLGTVFQTRVISRRSAIPWPPESPDLNPLDYWFWGHASAAVNAENPTNLNDIMDVVERFCQILTEDEITRSTASILRRMESCRGVNGRHFQHLL
jgi:hypothetical protein